MFNGFKSKEANRAEKEENESINHENNSDQNINLSEELSKLNDLKEKGVISQEEFEKAKNKLLNN